jgi:hypothetical protein
MKFSNPADGTEYNAQAATDTDETLQFASLIMDGATPDGKTMHLLRLELYPLPTNKGDMLNAMMQAMNAAAIQVMEQFGITLDLEAVFAGDGKTFVDDGPDTLQ